MKANQVSEHFDFIIENFFTKIACESTLEFILWGHIGTCPNVPHAYTYIILKSKIFLFLSPLRISFFEHLFSLPNL